LGGTGESRELAEALADRAAGQVDVTLSLAGRTRAPAPGPARLRIGGFGGAAGLAAYIRDEKIDLLVDATHPFAASMSANARAAADAAGTELLRLARPGWTAQEGDRWTVVPDADAAAEAVTASARRVFLTVGINELGRFERCRDVFFLIRLIEPPAVPPAFPDHRLVLDRGPFAIADEARLMRGHRIDTLVSKNSGGGATRAKLDAARELGIRVVMIDRPPEPARRCVDSVAAALDWIMDKSRNRP